jgi:CHAD domain-containing protein
MARPTEVLGLGTATPLAHAAEQLLLARLGDVRRQETKAVRLDVDAVHDMRVAVRRLRAALQLFRGGGRRKLSRALKPLQDALGAVRDAQVQAAWLAGAPGLAAPERATLRAWAERPLAEAGPALARELAAFEDRLAPRLALDAARERGSGRLGGVKIGRRVARRLAAFGALSEAARERPAPAPAHELRIAAKKLRYAAELVEPAFPGAAGEVLEALVPLQETLGALHDADVRVERLLVLAARGTPVERRAAEKLLVATRRERDARARALVVTLEGFEERRLVERVRRAFRSAPPRARAASGTPPGRTRPRGPRPTARGRPRRASAAAR